MDDAETDATPQKLPSYQVGDYVKISKLSYYGEIISMNKDKVCVLANGMKMNTTLQEIEPAVKQVQKTKKKGIRQGRRALLFHGMQRHRYAGGGSPADH